MHEGVNRLCAGIASLPWADQEYLLVVACGDLGQEQPEPHGDYMLHDLKARLQYLIDEVRITEHFLVRTLLDHLIGYWEELADPETTEDTITKFRMMASDLDEDLITPIEGRDYKHPDEEVLQFKEFAEAAAERSPAEREQAERVLAVLKHLKSGQLNAAFWDDYLG